MYRNSFLPFFKSNKFFIINFSITILLLILVFFYLITGLELKNFSAENVRQILFSLRIPRLILGIIVGSGLSISGVVFQSILQNPLAEPYTLGISGMVVLCVNFNLFVERFFRLNIPNFFSAILGAFLSTTIIYKIFSSKKFSTPQILLIGITLNVVSLAIVEFISNFLDFKNLYASKSWLIGNLSSEIDMTFYVMVFLIFWLFYFFYKKSHVLDILSLGEKHAIYLGINVKSEQKNLFLLASILVGFCAAQTGIIGFVGLMIPHLSRQLVGYQNKNVIITSALLGATYLLASDFIAKTIFYPQEIPVGVITGFLGGIFFAAILIKRGKYE